MIFSKVHHIAIICSNLEKSKKFYTEILGFKIIQEVYRQHRDSYKIDLDTGDSQIELFSFPNPPKRPSHPEATGLRHLAFEVDNIESAVNYLKSKNIDVEDIRVDEYTNKKFTFFTDPDDLPLEIYEV